MKRTRLRRHVNRLLPFLGLILVFFASACQETVPEPPEIAEQTEILWDEWGVPHIFATNSRDLFFASGWAQAQSHGSLILRLYGEARGRASEYWGEDLLPLDSWIRTVGIPVRAEEWYQSQLSPQKDYLDAFVEGVNRYAEEHPETIDSKVRQVLPVTGADVLGHLQRVIHFEFVTSPRIVQPLTDQMASDRKGSNAWAVGPGRSASGHAMLLANPHLPWSRFFLWNEMQLVSPEVRIYGACLVGLPFVGVGFNENLGWTHTVNTHDGQDLYELALVEGGYRWEGGVQKFDVREETIKVLQEDGSFREQTLEIKRSVHGPVVVESGKKAIALRVVGLYQTDLLAQYWEMSRARNLEEFETALSRLQMPLFTVIYADREGHILSLFGGLTPVRTVGDWNWRGIVPGDTARTLWTETHTYGQLPRVLDPAGQWVQNANEPPWTTTLPYAVDANQFPSYMAPRFMSFRAQRSVRILSEGLQITFDGLIAGANSTRMELADRILDELLSLLAETNEDKNVVLAETLKNWDRRTDAESRGALLFQTFWEEYLERLQGQEPFRVPWSEDDPTKTPSGFGNAELAVEAVQAAGRLMEEKFGAVDVPWGDIHRLRRGAVDLPASGGPGELGVFRVLFFTEGDDGKKLAAGGDSFMAAVEFSDPVRARVLTVTGASSNPQSPHHADQMELFARKELRPAWLTRAEIEEHLEKKEVVP